MIDDGYLDKNLTNPKTNKNEWSEDEKQKYAVCESNEPKQKDYKPTIKDGYHYYYFDKYYYGKIIESEPQTSGDSSTPEGAQ